MALLCVAFHTIKFKALEQLLCWHCQTLDNSINVIICFIKSIAIGITIAMLILFKVQKDHCETCWTK